MNSNRKYESIFIASIIVVCLTLGIITSLIFGAITISSVCFSISITSLVYWFLGGLESATFNIGYLKLGGSIAALLGGFYFINQELRKDNEFIYETITTEDCFAIGKTSGTPQTIYLKVGKNVVDSISAVPNDHFSKMELELANNLKITNGDFILGKLSKSELFKNGLFFSISESDEASEHFKLGVGETKTSNRLKFSLKTIKFDEYNTVEFQFGMLDSASTVTKTIKNKEIKIIEVDNQYFLIAATQADFRNSDNMFIEFAIKPIKLE